MIGSISTAKRFLLIKQWGYGFWSDTHDVWAKLLLAELTNRIPIVYWGRDSLYSVDENNSAFEQYFLPVSAISLSDFVSDKYTYHPPTWNSSNVFQTDPNRYSWAYRDVLSLINCDSDVLVSDMYNFAHEFMPYIQEGHPAYGLTEDDVYRYINHKYIRLQPDISQEIDEFYQTRMQTRPILAVHVRGGLPLANVPHWSEVNAQYRNEIDCYLKDNPSARIFLLTDDEAILEQYRQMYGNILVYTDCTRKTINDAELCLKTFPDKRRKGVEIIKDSFLASKCDHFIGNGASGVSLAISRLKAWDRDKIKLLWLP